MMKGRFRTKGQTLQFLSNLPLSATVLPVFLYTESETPKKHEKLTCFLETYEVLIARSSCSFEDTLEQSMAGRFLSIAGLKDMSSIQDAITAIYSSYGIETEAHSREEVLIQPQLLDACQVGVVFTKVPANGSDYIVVNFDSSGSHDAVTSGSTNNLNTCYIARGTTPNNEQLRKIVKLAEELMCIFDNDALDIEFAFDSTGELFLFQVRPLVLQQRFELGALQLSAARENIKKQLSLLNRPHPYLYGQKTIFGIMPDWNPAEIIGVRPKPLALSLYKELITDSIWAYQRSNYGYLNLRSFPLLISFCGMPYVDVRVSFNSFIPRELPPSIAERLVSYYLSELGDNPAHHDKVEFNIVLSCYSLDIEKKLERLKQNGFSLAECEIIAAQLRTLTNRIIDPRTGLWIQDFHKLNKLDERQRIVTQQISDPMQRIYWLLEDCKRYGTLPFAGLARAAFIAVQMLKSLVEEDVLSESQYNLFMANLSTVSSQMTEDFARLSKATFLEKYGHLRPGTYDIESPRYDEAPDLYFNWDVKNRPKEKNSFALTDQNYQKGEALLRRHGINHSVDSLLNYIKSAIEGREYAKFVFTRSLSDALSAIVHLSEPLGFSRADLAYLDVNDLLASTFDTENVERVIALSIETGKAKHAVTKGLNLPPLLSEQHEVDCFEIPVSLPNFVTENKVTAPIVDASDETNLSGKIVFITNADPGYDWLFSHSIAGLITQFGGCNSHMAIRANELDIPAVIGAGEIFYNKWQSAQVLEIDPVNKKVTKIR